MTEKPPTTGQFIGGLITGFVLGGAILMPIAVFGLIALFSAFKVNIVAAFLITYGVGAALGFAGAWRSREWRGFASGLLIGLAAGLLGLTALCNALIGSLGNMG